MTTTTTTKQVIVDNGKGQGAFGIGETWEQAMKNARLHWRDNFGTQKPTKTRLCEYDEASGTWRTVIRECRFVSWRATDSLVSRQDGWNEGT